MPNAIDPTSWRDDARSSVKTILLGMLDRNEIPDDGLWSGRLNDGGSIVHGLVDRVMLSLVDLNPLLLEIYPRGEALHYLKQDFGAVAKLLIRRRGYDLFPSEEASAYSRRTNHWRFVRLPSETDSPDRLLVIADYYRRRSVHHEAMSESRAVLSQRDAAQAELWKEESAHRAAAEPAIASSEGGSSAS